MACYAGAAKAGTPEERRAAENGDAGDQLDLLQVYPNTFNLSTTTAYVLAEEPHVKLKVINLAGQTVMVLAEGRLPRGRTKSLSMPLTCTASSTSQFCTSVRKGASTV